MKKATPPKAASKKPVAAKAGASKTGASSSGAKTTGAVKKTEVKKKTDVKNTDAKTAEIVKKTEKLEIEEKKNKPVEEKTQPKVDPITLPISMIAEFVEDKDKKIFNSPVWPLIIDEKEIAARFLQYQNLNLIQGFRPENMEPETIRKALLGAIRYGKPFAFDMMEVDFYNIFKIRFGEIMPELFDMLLDKSILKEENYKKLIKESDGDEYTLNKFSEFYTDKFMFLVVTSNPNQKTEFSDRMFRVTVQ